MTIEKTTNLIVNYIYDALAEPPQDALKPIDIGNLKGKSDINPQWRIEALTQKFGLCGIGWKFEIVRIDTFNSEGRILVFMQVNLFIKQDGEWSAPIPGYGGDQVTKVNKNGLVVNDEAYKGCLTDALGNAAKCIGVAGKIYRGHYDTKYSEEAAKLDNKPAYSLKKAEPARATEEKTYACTKCGVPITSAEFSYSLNKFGTPLCRKCQATKK